MESIAFIHAVMPFSCSMMSSSLALVSMFCCSTIPIVVEICCSTAEGPRFFGARSEPGRPTRSAVPAERWELQRRTNPPLTALRTDGSRVPEMDRTTLDTNCYAPGYTIRSQRKEDEFGYTRGGERKGKIVFLLLVDPLLCSSEPPFVFGLCSLVLLSPPGPVQQPGAS